MYLNLKAGNNITQILDPAAVLTKRLVFKECVNSALSQYA
jgi:hypothetical protein